MNPPATDRLTRRQEILDLAIWLGLMLSIFTVYAQVSGFHFVDYDDELYVYQNVHVKAGLTSDSVNEAFTDVVSANWMPVTLLSHTLDAQLFGMRSGLHHLENVLFHALSSILLFVILRRTTRAPGLSAFVAFVFALHPLHVESVAWVSERKDVLSTLFWFLALYAYVRYTEKPSAGRYLLIAAPFCLGLMSKPMLVTFPFTLLLLDLWPLRRFQWPKAIWEKLPLFALTAAASAVTYFVQKSAGAVTAIPLGTRLENVFISYVTYIVQMFWPVRLICFYDYPLSIPAWKAAGSIAVVLSVSVLVLLAWRTRPYLMVGWFWYLGTLVPVIGLVQVGHQAHADRYMYLPMIGLLVMLTWGAADLVSLCAGKWSWIKPAVAAGAVAACAACMALAWKQTTYWNNSETLFEHAVDAVPDNYWCENILGLYLNSLKRDADAVPHFEAALRMRPNEADVHNNLAVSLTTLGDCESAIPHYEAAIRGAATPQRADLGRGNLGVCLMTIGNYDAAIPNLEAAIRVNPRSAANRFSLAVSLSKIPGRAPEAIVEYKAALHLTPDDANLHASFGQFLASLGRTEEAIAQLEAAQSLRPSPAISEVITRLRAGQK